ncbi:OmpH family outer membrane protein [Pinibacter aurantiacus]|uniref:OmpH family outer membrane protein n=1 Tax=Pinibacter aurantiacus TaxID=2851599 RepID=A0A9E2W8R8_9BACT|nr:OmpH family outer membrane protein [Pinibacter aurantiacus]MBV4358921.1 OmpH family outer membrane protein [Pinibacter aurantiacus]
MNLSITAYERLSQLLFAIIALLLFGTTGVFAQEKYPERMIKQEGIGLQSPEMLTHTMTDAFMNYEEARQKFAGYSRYIKSMADSLKQVDSVYKKDIEELDKQVAELKSVGNNSKENLSEINRKAKEKKKEIQRAQRQNKHFLQEEMKASVKEFEKEINKAVQQVMVEMGYTRVFAVSAPARMNDITLYVIQKLNRKD